MSLGSGTQLGHYEILSLLGAGGMGEVYRARDTKLNREVALKVLPETFARDPERMARFEREAQVLASLNHPNIAQIYGLEESGETRALVMELVEGPTLAERIAAPTAAHRATLQLDETLAIAKQIADALEAAHDKNVIHRDLKPANIKVKSDGVVKVLDFGLAKAMDVSAVPASGGQAGETPTLQNSPTLSLTAQAGFSPQPTRAGMILGTAAYMSPEQAKGLGVDRRTDIWAFGCVFFEMLTGKRAFEGETLSDVLAAVIRADPDWTAIPETTPQTIQRLIHRCLTKDLKHRLQAIGEARITIEETLSGTPDAGAGLETRPYEDSARIAGHRSARQRALPWAAAAVAILATYGITRFFLPGAEREGHAVPARVTISLPADAQLAAGNFLPSMAFSPDGRSLAYVAEGTDGVRRLAVRQLNSDKVMVIPGTEGAEGPFFSPDGQWIGYWSHWEIWKVLTSGAGVPQPVCRSLDFRGAAWARNWIIFQPSQSGPLFKVADGGGAPDPFTKLLPGEYNERFPSALPDGDTILFTSWARPFDPNRSKIIAVSLSTGKRTDIGTGGMDVQYSPPGYLLYVQTGELLAVPFDVGKLKITGEPKVILDHVVTQNNTGAAQFAVSSQGDLAWIPGGSVGNDVRIVRVNRKGVETPIFETNTARRFPRLSPDGHSILVEAISGELAGTWLMSADGKEQRRLTPGNSPTWFPDGRRWVGIARRGNLVVDSVDGSSQPRQLVPQPPGLDAIVPTSVSVNGTVAYDLFRSNDTLEAWLVNEKGGTPKKFLGGQADEGGVQFSPDGHYVAYVSNRSCRFEVYVTSFPDKSATWQISTAGGSEVVWQRDGKEITYLSGPDMVAVPVATEPTFHAGSPSVLFHVPYDGLLGGPTSPNYDVVRDGSWFLMVDNPDLNQPAPNVQLALDWRDVLGKK